MKPGKLDLPVIWRGCDWGPVVFKWKDANGVAIDLNGWLPVAQSLNIDFKPEITVSEEGRVELVLTNAETATFKLGVENWDWIWQRVDTQYRYPPFLSGQVEIKDPISGVGTGGVITLPPPNDAFAASIPLTGLTGTVEGTNVNATRQSGEPAGENTVWYRWSGTGYHTATFHIGMNWLNIIVYTGANITHLTERARSSGNPSSVHFNTDPNVVYYIRLSKRTRTSDFNLVWNITARPPPP